MTVKIKVYSDYMCPFCFLAEKPLEEADITAVPTFVIGDTKVGGMRSKETLSKIIEEELNNQNTEFSEGIE